MYIKNLILGAGISGISAANILNKSDTIIFEKENYIGGLCNSFDIQGFIFDTAVHFSFTENDCVKNCFEQVDFYTHKPIAYNFLEDVWIKHPVENNLYPLSDDEKISCIKDFINKPHYNNINNYEEWLVCTYGYYIYEKFHKKYTNKYWCTHASNLSTNWVGKRLNIPSVEKVLKGALTQHTDIDYYTKEMRYPKYRGYKAFLSPMLDNVNIQLNMEAIKLDLNNKIVYFKDGSQYNYRNLISSIPLPRIISLIEDIPKDVLEASKKLITTSIILVSVGFKKEKICPYLWFYIYDEDILTSRVYSPSNKSINNAPSGCSSLQFEIYHTLDKPINLSDSEMKEHIKSTLLKMNLCKEEEILFMDIRNVEYGNVIFYNGMEKNRQIVLDYLRSRDVNLIGRFGEWEYFWSDQSFISGSNIANYIKGLDN